MSIQLATPYTQSGPGLVTESDSFMAITAVSVDEQANAVTFVYRAGTATVLNSQTTSFAVDPSGEGLEITCSLTTNTATATNGVTWPLTQAEITQVTTMLRAALTAVRNVAEADAFAHNVFGTGSTNVPWASGAY